MEVNSGSELKTGQKVNGVKFQNLYSEVYISLLIALKLTNQSEKKKHYSCVWYIVISVCLLEV